MDAAVNIGQETRRDIGPRRLDPSGLEGHLRWDGMGPAGGTVTSICVIHFVSTPVYYQEHHLFLQYLDKVKAGHLQGFCFLFIMFLLLYTILLVTSKPVSVTL